MLRIGIDFDNTIAGYDAAFCAAARERDLLPAGFAGSKRQVRDRIRELPDGELSWQRLQGYVYGAGMGRAQLIEGVAPFLRICRERNVDVYIVSHKTTYGHHDPDRVNLRDAARSWMEGNGFFDAGGFGLDAGLVFFEDTRDDKVARIAALECSHFIDDLEEVFNHEGFPSGVEKWLFAPDGVDVAAGPYRVFRRWAEMENRLFHESG